MKRHIIILLSCLILVFAIWIAGAHSFKSSWWIFENFFGDTRNLENIFAPQNALFSAIAAIGVVITIYYQISFFKTQHFEADFMNMLNIHVKTRSEVVYPFKIKGREDNAKICGTEAFISYFSLYKAICSQYIKGLSSGQAKYIPGNLKEEIEDHISQLAPNKDNPSEKELFKIAHRTFDEFTECRLWHYYRQIYRLLKYAYKNAPKDKRKEYLGIIRAHLSTHETVMIYYNALIHREHDSNSGDKSEFQILIENTTLFNNIADYLLFDENIAGKYAESAFRHNCNDAEL